MNVPHFCGAAHPQTSKSVKEPRESPETRRVVVDDLPQPWTVVVRMYAAMNAGDTDAAAACVSEDTQTILPDTVPFDGSRGGREGFRAFVAGLLTVFPDLRIELDAAMPLENAFVASLVATATGADGRPRTWRPEVLFFARDGLLRKQVVRLDNAQLLADVTAVGRRDMAA